MSGTRVDASPSRRTHRRRRGAVLITVTCLAAGLAAAGRAGGTVAAEVSCDTSWTNAAGGDWAVAANWSHGVPDQTKTACIRRAGTYTVTLHGSQAASELTLGGTSGQQTLTVESTKTPGPATLTLANQGANPDGIRAHGVLSLTGATGATGTSSVVLSAGTLRNSGMINVAAGPGTRALDGAVLNLAAGHVEIHEWTDAGAHDWTNEGSFSITAAATLDLHGGTLSSTGAVSGGGGIRAQLANAGLVSPGGFKFDTLSLRVAGYTQAAAGKLNEQIGPTGQSTLLDAGALQASLNGTVVVQPDPTFTPTVGQSFPVVTAASYTGQFTHVANALINQTGLYYRPDYPSGQPTLVVTQATFNARGAAGRGQKIALTGTGYRVSAPVRVSLTDSAGVTTVFKSPVTDASGSFTADRFIPAGAATGQGTLTAKDTVTGLTLNQPITIS